MYYIVRKMTQNKVDYSKSLIYKIVCNDTNIKNVYIGSTTSFSDRKQRHKTTCNKENCNGYNYPLYTFIRTNGGWDNWDMVLLDYTPCNTKLELHKIEREYLEKQDSNLVLNKMIPSRTIKEWTEDNKDKLNEYRKQYREANKDKMKEYHIEYREANKEYLKEYREANKDKIKEKQSEKIVCDKCGKLSSKNHIKRHQRGKNCIKI